MKPIGPLLLNSMSAWHILYDGQPLGPLSREEFLDFIANKNPSELYFWKEGLDDWTLAASVDAIASRMQITTEHLDKPAKSESNVVLPHAAGRPPRTQLKYVLAATGLLLFAGGSLLFLRGDTAEKNAELPPTEQTPPTPVVKAQAIEETRSPQPQRYDQRPKFPGILDSPAMRAFRSDAVQRRIFERERADAKSIFDPPTSSPLSLLETSDLRPHAIRVMRGGTEAEITGGFRLGLTHAFEEVLKKWPSIKVVHLDSGGGRAMEASSLFRLIKRRGLSTYVSTKCMSACAIAFTAGKQRYLMRDAVLGFHKAAGEGGKEVPFDLLQERLLTEAGLDKAFIEKAINTPHKGIWKPDIARLLKARVVTSVTDDTQFAASGFGDISREEFANSLTTISFYKAVRDKFPVEFARAANSAYDGIIDGKNRSEVFAMIRANVSVVTRRAFPFADDDVLADFAELKAAQYSALMKDPTACYGFATGRHQKPYQHLLPSDLMTRETSLQERAVRTATRRDKIDPDAIRAVTQKVLDNLRAAGTTPAQIDALSAKEIAPEKYDDFCKTLSGYYEQIAKLPRHDAAVFMRAQSETAQRRAEAR